MAIELIQKAIDTAPSPGAVLLKAGTYYVSNTIKMKRSGIVLRGEGEDKTIIKCTSTEDGNGSNKVSALIYLGSSASKVLGDNSKIIAKYVPVGQMWVPVANPEKFAVGDDVRSLWIEEGVLLCGVHLHRTVGREVLEYVCPPLRE